MFIVQMRVSRQQICVPRQRVGYFSVQSCSALLYDCPLPMSERDCVVHCSFRKHNTREPHRSRSFIIKRRRTGVVCQTQAELMINTPRPTKNPTPSYPDR